MTKEENTEGRSRRSSKRIFIVEDEWFLATMLEDMLAELGHKVVAVASKLKDGLVVARQAEFDFAILDVSLDGEMSHPIADILDGRGLPYVFATGYSARAAQGKGVQSKTPMLSKPFGIEELRRVLPEN
jgi:CheY-like chemotaxis protein